jgi:hypothetical protein
MENYALIILIVSGTVLFLVQRTKHKNELAKFAKESSERIQEYHVKLVKVCTEPESMEAKQIIHGVKFNIETEKVLWMGKYCYDISHIKKGLWGQIKDQMNEQQQKEV